jgi:hypothetical protein
MLQGPDPTTKGMHCRTTSAAAAAASAASGNSADSFRSKALAL